MSINENLSEAEQALAELREEGHEIDGDKPEVNEPEIDNEETVSEDEPEAEGDDQPEVKVEKEEEEKPDRVPTMVPAWKLKVAKEQATNEIAALQSKIEELSNSNISKQTSTEINEELEAIIKTAEDNGLDGEFLRNLATSIESSVLKRVKPNESVEKLLKEIEDKKILADQEDAFDKEFSKTIAPMAKEKFQITDKALADLKSKLKDLAFSEEYGKLPLSKVFNAEIDSLGIKTPKRSAEGKDITIRANNSIVDMDNVSEDDFSKMSDKQIEEFEKRQTQKSGWQRK